MGCWSILHLVREEIFGHKKRGKPILACPSPQDKQAGKDPAFLPIISGGSKSPFRRSAFTVRASIMTVSSL